MESLELFEGRVVCPLCNNGGGGLIYQALLLPIGTLVYICDECESVWLDANDIIKNEFLDFTLYVNSFGYKYEHIVLLNKDYYWYTKHKEEMYDTDF